MKITTKAIVKTDRIKNEIEIPLKQIHKNSVGILQESIIETETTFRESHPTALSLARVEGISEWRCADWVLEFASQTPKG